MKKSLKRIIPKGAKIYIGEKIIPSLHRADIYISKIFFWTKTKWYKKWLGELINKTGIKKINAGCGPEGIKGWINIGIFPNFQIPYGLLIKKKGIEYINYDLTCGIPAKNKSINYIHNSHFIEHLDLPQGIKFFKEAYRALKKGGVIRTSCPDLEKYARKYIEKDKNFYNHPKIREFCYYPEAKTCGEIFIAKAYDNQNLHRWFYDAESLIHLHREAGFKKVKIKKTHQSRIKDIKKIEPKYRAIESVYIEAIK